MGNWFRVKKDNYIMKLFQNINLDDKVSFYEWTDDISQYLNVADLLICPSRHEPFGNNC